MLIRFAEICKKYYIQGIQQVISITDIIINKNWYDSLPPNLQAVIDESMLDPFTYMINMNVSENSTALSKLVKEDSVIIEDTPEEYVSAYMAASNKVVKKYADADPFFKKVYDSMQKWAELTVPYQKRVNGVYYNMGKAAMDAGIITEYKK